jgi:uncharacterized protein (DUF1778 family)
MGRREVAYEDSKEAGAFRVGATPAQKERMREAARKAGKTLSGWVLKAALQRLERETNGSEDV